MSAADNPGFRRGELTVHRDPAELARVTRALRSTGRTVHLVPTMGALHRGHMELIQRARDVNAVVVVSIFVNPLQFGPNEDFDRYPRSFADDVEACREAGVGIVFAPGVEEMYPPGRQLSVQAGPLGDELEGATRKGHFDGMLTVVLKLLNIVRPNLAFFGEKDYQQLTLIRKMAREFNLDTEIQGIPTIREADGLALSSRNVYLSEEQRSSALALSAALTAGAHAGKNGPRAVLDAAREVLATEPEVDVDYLELRDPELAPVPQEGEARLLVAAKVGATRLIDNAKVLLGE